MIVSVLAEDTSASDYLRAEHGFSVHIETKGRGVLFDTGASGMFAENAEWMGIDLAAVDVAVISHGHYDHGGGIRTFLRINDRAMVHLQRQAFEPHYARRSDGRIADIGLDRTLLPNGRFVFCGPHHTIGGGLEVFSGVSGTGCPPSGDRALLAKRGEALVPDDFAHEQSLIVEEEGRTLLLAGCAHQGIANVVDRFAALKGRPPDVVVGGFHLNDGADQGPGGADAVESIGRALRGTGGRFHTCHCTGQGPYRALKAVMGENIDRLSTGSVLKI